MEIIITVVLISIGATVGIIISYIPVLICYKVLTRNSHSASPVWMGGIIGCLVWLVTYPLYFYIDKTNSLFIFAERGGESGMITGGILLFLSLCTLVGFILSGVLVTSHSNKGKAKKVPK
jgi:hypothetical protein